MNINEINIQNWPCNKKDEVIKAFIETTFFCAFNLLDDYINDKRSESVIEGLKNISIILGEPTIITQLKKEEHMMRYFGEESRWQWLMVWFENNRKNILKYNDAECRWNQLSQEQKDVCSPPAPFKFDDIDKIRKIFKGK
jgi:hypothetical protein